MLEHEFSNARVVDEFSNVVNITESDRTMLDVSVDRPGMLRRLERKLNLKRKRGHKPTEEEIAAYNEAVKEANERNKTDIPYWKERV